MLDQCPCPCPGLAGIGDVGDGRILSGTPMLEGTPDPCGVACPGEMLPLKLLYAIESKNPGEITPCPPGDHAGGDENGIGFLLLRRLGPCILAVWPAEQAGHAGLSLAARKGGAGPCSTPEFF